MLDNEFWGFDNADLCWKSSMKEIRFTIIGTDGWRKQTNACSSQRSMRNFSLKMFARAESSVFVAIRRTAWRTLCKWHQHSLVHPLKSLVFLLFNFYFLTAHVFASVLLVWRAALQMNSHISVKGLFWFCVLNFHAVVCNCACTCQKSTGSSETCFIYGRRTASNANFDSF